MVAYSGEATIMSSDAKIAINDKLRIMYVIGEFPAVSQTFILNQITDIIRRGYDIKIYAWRKGDIKLSHPEIEKFHLMDKTVFAPLLPKSKFGRLWFALTKCRHTFSTINFFMQMMSVRKFGWGNIIPFSRFIRGLHFAHYVNKYNPDILHIHFGNNAVVPVCAKKTGLFKNTKIVITFHGHDLHNISSGSYDELFEVADIFTVNSIYSRGQLLALGCPEDKIIKLPVGLDCSVFNPNGNSVGDDVINIIYIGRLIPNKGILVAIRAIAKLKKDINTDIYFDVIGDGELRNEATALAVALGIESNVCFHGSLQRGKIISLMNNADVFLFPGITGPDGRQENQGLVIQEAQAMELPVIVSDVGGVPEGVLDGQTGYVLPKGDVAAIVDKLKLLIADPELRISMGKRGREYVLENFTSERLGNILENSYKGLMS